MVQIRLLKTKPSPAPVTTPADKRRYFRRLKADLNSSYISKLDFPKSQFTSTHIPSHYIPRLHIPFPRHWQPPLATTQIVNFSLVICIYLNILIRSQLSNKAA